MVILLVMVAALAACSSNDGGRITALEEGLSRAEAQELKSREAVAERLSALEQALEQVLEQGLERAGGGAARTSEQMLREVGMEREKAAAKSAALPNGGCPAQTRRRSLKPEPTAWPHGDQGQWEQGMREEMRALTLENYRLNAERTDDDGDLVMMAYMDLPRLEWSQEKSGSPPPSGPMRPQCW